MKPMTNPTKPNSSFFESIEPSFLARRLERVYKPNSVLRHAVAVAAIHLGGGLLRRSSDLPGGASPQRSKLGRAALSRLPIWSCTAESLPSRGCRHPRWWALTPPFHPSPEPSVEGHRLVCFLLHLSSGHPAWVLPSPLPCGVRTFLWPKPATARPTPAPNSKYNTTAPAHCQLGSTALDAIPPGLTTRI
jgi:hypothetical protein